MTPRQARRERREAERKSKKAAIRRKKAEHFNQAPAAAPVRMPENFGGFVSQKRRSPYLEANGTVEPLGGGNLDTFDQPALLNPPQSEPWPDGFVPQTPLQTSPIKSTKRAEANRANAQLSTGPRTPQGKLASSRNSTKHGLASGQLIIPGEDPAGFAALLEDLVADHRPATPTEDVLVKEMAQSYWLAQRALRLQNECFTEQGIDEKHLALFLRYQTTHNRAFYKALNTLLRLKKEVALATRGFVSQPRAQRREWAQEAAKNTAGLDGFVPENAHDEPANISAKTRREAA